ncbi:hypothetical protein [Paraburkholderia caribensis]|uniref:hypothetical protein n=1 Tax=Paraburkholderia caribensis TaxID=75105 RepID=UPI0034D2FC2E
MNSSVPQVVIDVTLSVKVGKDGTSVATVERVKDALGDDRTDMFKDFAAREGLDLTKQDRIEAVAAKFAETNASILP